MNDPVGVPLPREMADDGITVEVGDLSTYQAMTRTHFATTAINRCGDVLVAAHQAWGHPALEVAW